MVAAGGFAVGFAAAMVAVMAGVTVNVVEIQTFIAQNGAVNGCLPDPCENGGTCTREDRLGNFTCTCPDAYTGTTCSDDNVFCTSDPCQNGGTCTELYPGYNCTCATGYEGTHCENATAPEEGGVGNFTLLQSKLNLIDTAGIFEGTGVSVSGDGLRIAQGAYSYDTPASGFGMFSVYSRSGAGENFTDESGLLQGTTGGTNETFTYMGRNLALDYDGDTLVVGGNGDGSGNEGAVWVFTRTGSSWSQQGAKLTPNVASGDFGKHCDVSDDGDTLVASQVQGGLGEMHVYTRSGETWSAHASNPLVPSDGTNRSVVSCVKISGDASTIIVGFSPADIDGTNTGGAWVFVDNGTAWVQQGVYINASIVGENSQIGASCAISYDGNVAVLGTRDSTVAYLAGAAVVYERTGETWAEVAIVRHETPEASDYTDDVALSANATILAIGGYQAGTLDYGAVEVYASAEGNFSSWTKVGGILEPTGSSGDPSFSRDAVSMNADGSVIAVGGPDDVSNKGAVWVFSNE